MTQVIDNSAFPHKDWAKHIGRSIGEQDMALPCAYAYLVSYHSDNRVVSSTKLIVAHH